MNESLSDEGAVIRFIVDRTAGKLARWLRILGLDVEYVSTCDSSEVARLARRSQRRALTRNRNLAERLRDDAIFLKSEHLREQLRQVVDVVGHGACKPFSRCNVCNAKLVTVEKACVKGRVPEYVYSSYLKFSMCPSCGRYYWHGTHWQRMAERIRLIVEGEHNESK